MPHSLLPRVVLLATLASCATTSEMDNLRSRAAFELDCPADQIQVSNLDDENKTYGVNACGRRAVYLWHCRGGGLDEDCKWVLNSTTRRD